MIFVLNIDIMIEYIIYINLYVGEYIILAKNYGAKDIQILEGLDAVRTRPGMYIGTTGSKGLHHILWEIVDNAIDEAANGHADTIKVQLYSDGSASVNDNGRGIPVDKHPKLGVSGVEVVFTQLHAGAKFGNENYGFSGGLHGVGASVTNALSRWLTVEVYKEGKTYIKEFESVEISGKIRSGLSKGDMSILNKASQKKGTFVRFLPDDRVFGKEKFNYDVIAKRLRELAFLNGGVKIELITERKEDFDLGKAKSQVYEYKGGISDFILYMNAEKTQLNPTPIFVEDKKQNFEVAVALQYTDGYTENIFSYVNNIPTTEGGTHETGFKAAYTKVMNDYARSRNLLKEKDANLLGEDFREGLTAVITVKMQNVQFEGQTKTKLGNVEVRSLVENAMIARLTEYLEKVSTHGIADKIIEKALGAARVRMAQKHAKDLARQQKGLGASALVGKLASCTSRKAEECELFIVEGNSAGGTAKQGRNNKFQAILPLRGKPLNAEKKHIGEILDNEEIRLIISALDAGFDQTFNIDDLRYHKIVILSDADQDGGHIRSILLTFFFRYMKPLILEGKVYIGMPPLYKLSRKDKVMYAYDDVELEKVAEEMGGKYDLQRYKGLGEMNPEQLWETTLNPETRQLMKVTIDDAAGAEKMISILMGSNIEARKAYINEHANFNKHDKFVDMI